MEEAHIYVYGEIDAYQDKQAAEYGFVNLTSVRDQYEAQKDAKKVIVHIHSVGGVVFEGFAIHDYLRSLGKPIETRIEGLCASIATVISLAGDVRSMTENSDFFIHNPWGMAVGDRAEMEKYTKDLERLENKLADFYASKTSLTAEDALALMKQETTFTAAQALEKGFITETAAALKIVAKFDPNKDFTNHKKEDMKDKRKALTLVEKITALIKGDVKNKIIQDGSGTELDFIDLADTETPVVGDKAEVDGKAAEGDFTMTDGEVYKFTAGELTEIVPVADPAGNEALDAANAEIEKLKGELADANAAKDVAEAAKAKAEKKSKTTAATLAQVQTDVTALKAEIGSDFETKTKENKHKETEGEETKSRPLFKNKKQ